MCARESECECESRTLPPSSVSPKQRQKTPRHPTHWAPYTIWYWDWIIVSNRPHDLQPPSAEAVRLSRAIKLACISLSSILAMAPLTRNNYTDYWNLRFVKVLKCIAISNRNTRIINHASWKLLCPTLAQTNTRIISYIIEIWLFSNFQTHIKPLMQIYKITIQNPFSWDG